MKTGTESQVKYVLRGDTRYRSTQSSSDTQDEKQKILSRRIDWSSTWFVNSLLYSESDDKEFD